MSTAGISIGVWGICLVVAVVYFGFCLEFSLWDKDAINWPCATIMIIVTLSSVLMVGVTIHEWMWWSWITAICGAFTGILAAALVFCDIL